MGLWDDVVEGVVAVEEVGAPEEDFNVLGGLDGVVSLHADAEVVLRTGHLVEQIVVDVETVVELVADEDGEGLNAADDGGLDARAGCRRGLRVRRLRRQVDLLRGHQCLNKIILHKARHAVHLAHQRVDIIPATLSWPNVDRVHTEICSQIRATRAPVSRHIAINLVIVYYEPKVVVENGGIPVPFWFWILSISRVIHVRHKCVALICQILNELVGERVVEFIASSHMHRGKTNVEVILLRLTV